MHLCLRSRVTVSCDVDSHVTGTPQGQVTPLYLHSVAPHRPILQLIIAHYANLCLITGLYS